MKTYDETISGIFAVIVILITAIFDYINASTLQAVVNALAALIVTMTVRKIFIWIKHYRIKQRRRKCNDRI